MGNFIKNTNLRIKIQNIYILHTNKFDKDNAKHCSQKTKLQKVFAKIFFRKQIERN